MSIVLNDTDKKLEILLNGAVAANELPFTAGYADYVDATPAFTPGANDGVTNGANPVELAGVPGASTQRLVNNISIYNKDTSAATVTIQYEHGAAHREIVKVELAVGYSLHFREDQWQVLSTTGCVLMTMAGSVFSDGEGDPAAIEPDDAAADGTSGYAARRDHQHQFTCATPVDTGVANAEGAATTSARSNHVHKLHDHDHTGDAGDGAKLDHGAALNGLGDDDHTQYLLASGARALSGAWAPGQIVTFLNQGLHLLDTGGDHDLIIAPGTDLTVDRILTLTTGDAARTITLSGNPTLDDWFDQSVKQAATPIFGGVSLPTVTFSGATGANVITVPDNLADALHLSDAGGIEYLKVISTNTQPIVRFNDGGVDVDFEVEAVGVADALQVRGADGQITLGALTAGYVKSSAAGVLSVSAEVALIDIGSYGVGRMIIGGAADWAALSPAGAAGYAIVSDATSFVWDQTPAWTGLHTFNAGASIAAGQGLAMGDASWLGIAGNELLTVNAAGNFTFSGITSLVVPDGCWVGADAACSWVFDSTSGDVTTLDKVGVGTSAPGAKMEVREDGGILRLNYPTASSYGQMGFAENGVPGGYIQQIGSTFATVARRNDLELASTGAGDIILAPGSGYVGIGTTAPTAELEVNGEIKYHSLTDITCANFKAYSDSELLDLISLQPRTDGIYHKSTPTSKAFPHIDFSKVHPDIAAITKIDKTITRVYSCNSKGKYEKAQIDYRMGDQYGIDFGSFVYAIAEHCVRLNSKIETLEGKHG